MCVCECMREREREGERERERDGGREGEIETLVGERSKLKNMCNNRFPLTGEDYVWGSSRDGYKCTGMFCSGSYICALSTSAF